MAWCLKVASDLEEVTSTIPWGELGTEAQCGILPIGVTRLGRARRHLGQFLCQRILSLLSWTPEEAKPWISPSCCELITSTMCLIGKPIWKRVTQKSSGWGQITQENRGEGIWVSSIILFLKSKPLKLENVQLIHGKHSGAFTRIVFKKIFCFESFLLWAIRQINGVLHWEDEKEQHTFLYNFYFILKSLFLRKQQ